jgi:hypothetical protein
MRSILHRPKSWWGILWMSLGILAALLAAVVAYQLIRPLP